MKKNKKSRADIIKTLLRVLGTTIFGYLVLSNIEFSRVIESLSMLEPASIALSMLLFFAANIIGVYRWKTILNHHSVKAPFMYLFCGFSLGMLSNIFIPTSLGGEFTKVYHLSKRVKGAKMRSSLAVAVDKAFGLSSTLFVMLICLLLFDTQRNILYAAILFVSTSLAFLSLSGRSDLLIEKLLSKYLKKYQEKIMAEIRLYSKNRMRIVYLGVVSLVVTLISLTYRYYLFIAVGGSAPILLIFIALMVSKIVTILPLSFAGLGAIQLSIFAILSVAGVEMHTIVAFSAAGYAMHIVSALSYSATSNFLWVTKNQ